MTAVPCGCCEPWAPLTPLAVVNRAGLDAIAYRVGTYASFRETMLEDIAHAPELAHLTTREDDDYAVTVLDLWAAVGDVLTFYQERYANEAFLRTATLRESIGRLARLIDYSLRPGVAALAWLAFTVDAGKLLDVPVRLRVQSVPGQNELPQVFETIEAIRADARLNRARALPLPYGASPLAPGTTEALVSPGQHGLDSVAGIAAGDRLLVYAEGVAGRVEELTVSGLRIADDSAALAWTSPVTGSWTRTTPVSRFGRTFRLFGHSAPKSAMVPRENPAVPGGISWSLDPTDPSLPASPDLALDARVDGIVTGTRLLVDDAAGATTAVTVSAVRTGPVSLAGLTDTVTLLSVTPAIPAVADRRNVTLYELTGPAIALWGYAYPQRLTGGTLLLSGARHDDDTIEIGRTIARNAYQPGVRLGVDDVGLRRTVLVGDAATDPVAATIDAVSLCGATVLVEPTAADATSVRELGLDAASADVVAGAMSAPLPASIALRSATPALRVRIGDLPARTVALAPNPTTRAAARVALESALRAAGSEAAFAEAAVHRVGPRLIVFAGVPGLHVTFMTAPGDATTVRDLGLDHDLVAAVHGFASAPLSAPPVLSAAAPRVAVTIGPVGPRTVALSTAATLDALAAELRLAVAGADPAPGFADVVVLASGPRVVILPGPVGAEIAEYLRIDLALDDPLDLDTASAYLLGNVAAASHGESVRGEVVGSGDASAPFPRLALKKAPLTFVPRASAGALRSSLEVSVNGVRWDEAPGLYGEGPDAQVYASRVQDDGTTVVQFGDGRTGAPVPTGAGNITATYRTGAGVVGRVRARTLTSALDRPPGLKDVVNPLPAHGGADPELMQDARANAPTTVRTFGRAVSVQDFADLVRDSRQVAKAQAIWVWDGFDRAVHVTVAGQSAGTFTAEDLRLLGSALAQARQPSYRLRLANFTAFPILLSATIRVDRHFVRTDVLAATREALLAALAFDAVELGEPLHLSDMYRVIQDVAGVVSADIDALQPKRPADRDRPNVDCLSDGTPAPLQPHVRILPARPDPAHRGRVLPAELACIEDPTRDLVLGAGGGSDA